MNVEEAEILQKKIEPFLTGLWEKYNGIMLGHGARVGAGGEVEVFVAFTGKVELPPEVNGVRVVSVVRPRAYLLSEEKPVEKGPPKFVIVSKENDRKTRDIYTKKDVTPVLYYTTDLTATFAQGGVWLQSKGHEGGGASFTPHGDRAATYSDRKAASEMMETLVREAGFVPGDLEVEELKEPERDGEVHP